MKLYERSHFNSSGLNEGLPLWEKNSILHRHGWQTLSPWWGLCLPLSAPGRVSLLCHCLISSKHKHRRSHVPHTHPGCSQLHGWQSTIMLWRQTTYVRAILTTVGEWLQYKSYLMSVLYSEECAGEESRVLFTKAGLHVFHNFLWNRCNKSLDPD